MTDPADSGRRDDPSVRGTRGHATTVGAGIFLSRLTGVARDVAVAAFLGTRISADAYWAAIKIPNIIRNLLGEGTLSASFVPIYNEQLEADRTGGADVDTDPPGFAASVLGVVIVVATLLTALGVLLAPWITGVVLGTSDEATRVLTTSLIRILFPMSGVLMIGAWFLGVLISHDRFFRPFVAPTLWNLAQVGALLWAASAGATSLAHALAWGALVGSILQVGIQVRPALRLSGIRGPSFRFSAEPVRRMAANAIPVISSQGIFQLSSLVDLALAGLAGTGALAALGYSQRLVYLPISLFGVSVAAASLPTMSRDARAEAVRRRLVNGFFEITYFVLPAAAILWLFGDLAVGVLYERNAFDDDSTALVAAILAAYAAGLVAMSNLKLFASGFHALQDTKTPMKIAAVAVGIGIAISLGLTLWLRSAGAGVYSAVGIVLGGVVGSWLNLGLMWIVLTRRLDGLFGRASLVAIGRLLMATTVASGAGWLARAWLDPVLGEGFFPGLGVLGAVLVAGGLPYLALVRRPPRPAGVALEHSDAD